MTLQYQPSLEPPTDPHQDEIYDLMDVWYGDIDLMIEDLGHSRLVTLLSRALSGKDLELSTLAHEVIEERKYNEGWSSGDE